MQFQASEKLVESFDKKSMDSVAAFISFYHTQGQLLCEKLIEARSTIISSNAELEKINKELEDLEKLWGESSTAYYEKYLHLFTFCCNFIPYMWF